MIELIINKKYNFLTCIERIDNQQYKFLCLCGKKIITAKYNVLKSKGYKSCGCQKVKTRSGEVSGLNALYAKYIHTARKRNLEFDLSLFQFKELTKRNCMYCDMEPKQYMYSDNYKRKTSEYIYNGIDRVNNKIGYNINNCVTCCHLCNYMKSELSKEDFLNHVKKIVNFNNV